MKGFSSPLGQHIQTFITLKRAMGRSYETPVSQLRCFDRYLSMIDPPPEVITRALVHDWLTAKPELSPHSIVGRASILRQFCLYLVRIDSRTYVPERELLRVALPVFRPHIYSKDEVRRLVKAALSRSPRACKLRPATLATMVLLLYGTGIRRAEICKLRLADVDLQANTLFVHRTKFYKSRLVPFSEAVARRLHSYLERRLQKKPTSHDEPFFPNRCQRPFAPRKLSAIFHELVTDAGIVSAPGRRRPRLHDMRHTFAVHRLLQWYREDADLEQKLPLLADYMGHGNVLSTHVYLNSTAEILREASGRFERAYGCLVVPSASERGMKL